MPCARRAAAAALRCLRGVAAVMMPALVIAALGLTKSAISTLRASSEQTLRAAYPLPVWALSCLDATSHFGGQPGTKNGSLAIS